MAKWLSSLLRELESLAKPHRWTHLARAFFEDLKACQTTSMAGMDALGRTTSGSLASTSGRAPQPSAAAAARALRPPGSGARRLHPSAAMADFQSGGSSAWGPGPSRLPPPSSLAAPSAPAAPLGGTLAPQRGITTYPTAFSALPELEDVAAAAAAAASVVLEGTIKKIHYRSDTTAYTVLRLALSPASADKLPENLADAAPAAPATARAVARAKGRPCAAAASRRRQEVTVVGTFPLVTVGQSVRVSGAWMAHPQYGTQLKAAAVEDLVSEGAASGDEAAMVAYLSGGIIPGVGPVTAARIVAGLGAESVLDALDSPAAVELLCGCEGVGRSKAEKIKAGWDAGREARQGSQFLTAAGVPPALAQRVAESLTAKTEQVVKEDPYVALGAFGLPLVTMDRVAARVEAPPDLVSRAAAALERALAAAAQREGHTHLTWSRLEREALRVLEELGLSHGTPWPRPEALHLVAQHMHTTGRLVVEPYAIEISSDGNSSEEGEEAGALDHSSSFATPSLPAPAAPATEEEVHMAVRERLPGATSQQLSSLLEAHGTDLPSVLDAPSAEAIEALVRCKRIGPKTAQKLKAQWDASAPAAAPAGAPAAGSCFGLLLSDLEDAPPRLDFPWSSDVKCYLPRLHAAEVAVARAAAERAAAAAAAPAPAARLARIAKWIERNQMSNGVTLSAGQCAAIEAASDAPILVITGGPGCGKTTVVQSIVKLWCAQRKLVHICAPTGRAAQRMGTIQGIEPSTIHRLLRYQPRGNDARAAAAALQGGASGLIDGAKASDGEGADAAGSDDAGDAAGPGGFFELGPSNQLVSDAVLVDEASMLSLPLAAALMQALKSRTQLVLVGDADQLPPVGPGGVLHSLIASGIVPVVDLREVFRQAATSAIVTSALAVRRGEVPALRPATPDASALLEAGTDALVVRAPDADIVPDVVYDTVGALASAESFVEGDLQVITPMRRGPAGSAALNLKLQQLLNPPHPEKAEISRGPGTRHRRDGEGEGDATPPAERVFRVGDRVLQTVNNYDKDVFNGDQGYIVSVDPKHRTLLVEFPLAGGRSGGSGSGGIGGGSATGTDCLRAYQGVELSQLELAYAVTVHKAQGGEARHVVLALSPVHGRMLTRRLLYTGLTRAKELLVVVAPEGGTDGREDPLAVAVRHREGDAARIGALTSRLQGEGAVRGLPHQEPLVFSNEQEVLHGNLDAAVAGNEVQLSAAADAGHAARQHEGRAEVEVVALCADLGLDAPAALEVAAAVSGSDALQLGQAAVSADAVNARVAALAEAATAPLPPLFRVLCMAPYLITASDEFFYRSLDVCQRLGPLDVGGGAGNQDDSLVDQLRRVLGAAQSH